VVQRKSRGSFEFEKEDPAPFEVGRALVNYSAAEIKRIRGVKSTEIHGVLGYADSEYIALRENIAFGNRQSRPTTPSRMSMSHEAEQRH
jgi:glutamate 5-kinase